MVDRCVLHKQMMIILLFFIVSALHSISSKCTYRNRMEAGVHVGFLFFLSFFFSLSLDVYYRCTEIHL